MQSGVEGLEDMSPEEIRAKYPKWFGTFPYAYMNGSLHLGHAFSLSKVEFAVGYERMKGRRALFPWAFHCTGMPIKAASDKLVNEISKFGADFSGYRDEEEDIGDAPQPPTSSVTQSNAPKLEKGKLAAKSGGLKYQFQILENMGVERSEIHKFADPVYWLRYFPPIAKADTASMGARLDWRRAFLTTDVNPYYDSFVRWQMNLLRSQQKIAFGERYTIYSPKDGQPCMDHDRSSGEALGPQEYTALKMEVSQWGERAAEVAKQLPEGSRTYFVAATLRPETMYGQTNCFVGPAIEYGLFQINEKDVYLCTDRAARNMAFQGVTKERGVIKKLASVKGEALLGTKIKAPFGIHPEVYLLPMQTVLATKGTGVVTSVPSDSPDDYINLMELRKKAAYYKIDESWVQYDPIPVIETPTYGGMTAEALVKKLKIQSPKDALLLAEAKDQAYKEGFYSGTMLVGDFKGQTVQEAKPKVRDQMIAAGLAFPYAEPEGLIISRSSDECVVALCDQWYLDYGETSWKEKAAKLLAQMNTFQPETRNAFEQVLGWLHQWACARSYGLGSKLPWDPQYLVESLSDSTIYMSYYTVAHLLQGGVEDGSVVGPLGVKAEDLTDEAWSYIFNDAAPPASCNVPLEKLNILRREFRYFYPFDLRSSGKDLIPNHLTFCIYNHAALFPEEHWPRAMRINGHLMLNGKKMSKSTGNSLTMRQSVEKFGADATRLSLADAGDSIEDANFEEKTANANILRLHTLLLWCEEVLSEAEVGKLRTGAKTSFWDKVFENDINSYIFEVEKLYEKAWYKDVCKFGFYELQSARDLYRDATAAEGGMHIDLVKLWIRTQALLIAPIAPHFAEHLYRKVLGESGSVQTASFPKPSAAGVDKAVSDAAGYVKEMVKTIRDAELALVKRKSKGKAVSLKYDERARKAVRIFIARSFPAIQDACIAAMRSNYDAATNSVDDAAVRAALTEQGLLRDKRAMPFVMAFKKRLAEFGAKSFERALPFDERETVKAAEGYLKRTLGFEEVILEDVDEKREDIEKMDPQDKKNVEIAEPGSPGFVFYNIQ
ncbi:leucyl-tRNA synthetase [Jaminaea rosea]|uniref:leucine--tRNA ligase n=1 Tax=Jaminaea rosea TaxID=1569628 RepID=A0A316UII8_9BASI|nr:leucyl-tRNA synthetase [Jaminaea rosea]PWN25082.1 leucyl-tRNA synthetase [Jaminaea rosea]